MSAEEIPELLGQTPTGSTGTVPTPDTRPRSLTFSSVSRDGSRLHLVDGEGHEFVLTLDDRFRGALEPLVGARRLENKMEASLRPRDIQARIRSGESPESVAEAANTTVDRIMAFAAPVLAERQHIAQRAQGASVRRRVGETGGARTLGNAVAGHLAGLDIDPETIEWDAWRRHDGRWTLVALVDTPQRSGTAELTFDARGNFVSLDNDDARWLVGERPPAPAPASDDLQEVRARRLSAVSPTPSDLTGDRTDDDVEDDFHAPRRRPGGMPRTTPQPIEAFLEPDDTPTAEQPAIRERADVSAEEPAEDEAGQDAAPQAPEPTPARRTVKKSRGRASVPSWDEIMFGGGSSD
ncbi:septation protein SepH [Nocardioides insulae]|uniref:septation protein SepH n=1 Tax=Nocardioides insulae TaxID=394734 RepID=UPI00040B99A8|nr:septation protein SepH [Nocardioides insulae]